MRRVPNPIGQMFGGRPPRDTFSEHDDSLGNQRARQLGGQWAQQLHDALGTPYEPRTRPTLEQGPSDVLIDNRERTRHSTPAGRNYSNARRAGRTHPEMVEMIDRTPRPRYRSRGFAPPIEPGTPSRQHRRAVAKASGWTVDHLALRDGGWK